MIRYDPIMEGFAERLKTLRQTQGRTQAQLAEQIRVPRPRLSEYETGKRVPSLETARRIAEVTGSSLDWLVLGRKK